MLQRTPGVAGLGEGGAGLGERESGEGEGRGVPDEEVSRLVLVMEQRMGTGGGWQDQVINGARTTYLCYCFCTVQYSTVQYSV